MYAVVGNLLSRGFVEELVVERNSVGESDGRLMKSETTTRSDDYLRAEEDDEGQWIYKRKEASFESLARRANK